MNVPVEFTKEYIEANSPKEEQLYTAFLGSGEPYRSINRHNFHMGAREGYAHDPAKAPADSSVPGLDLEDDELYYNTTGSAAAYWKQFDLPKPTKDIRKLRADLREWGYCLIEDALSKDQYVRMKKRLSDQAAGERKAGIACWTGTPLPPGENLPRTQFLHTLINKGEQFIQCVEHDPRGVQGGPLIEQILKETMGPGFLMSSFIGIMPTQYNMPQGLHMDQAMSPFVDSNAPFTVNTMYIMDDLTAFNGGTLVVPGSHRLLSEIGSGNPVEKPLPPAINLEAPAGTVMMFEGRLLHGTGVNQSDAERIILVMNSVKAVMRQQELHMLSAAPDVLENASAKLLYRLGAYPGGLGGVEGAWAEYIVNQRFAIERGEYIRVRELSPDSSVEELSRDYGYRYSESGRHQASLQPESIPEVARYHSVEPAWQLKS
ncbi:MAG: phytanoyl-CoA dioxygenase family protein [Proteobacteria bacterium]|jgi:ectoine hydroxylase-related dioxygenase (phytanoyl-CoA dioxygenase family)|nr:phytanoyl-CoA dioxygenase family protein [Pseudomonadota bacterium]